MPFVIVIPILIIVAVVVGFFFWNQSNRNENTGTTLQTEVTQQPIETITEQAYADGTYTKITRYFTPKRVEHKITTTIDLEDDVIVGVNVIYDDAEAKTPSHLSFDGAYRDEVLGRKLDEINPSRVGGSSLTTASFNEAVGEIKSEAQNVEG